MKNLIIAIAVLAIFAGMASARGYREAALPAPYDGQHQSRATQVFFDDMETGAPGWTHGDASAQPHYWHITGFMPYVGNNWYCGDEALTVDGGYGNLWKQYLTTPPIDWTGYSYPVVTYAFRADCENGFDFGYVRADSAGGWVNLNRGYTHRMPWGTGGYYLGNKSNPAVIQFFFESDLLYSDGDGLYASVGGGFAVDDVVVMDYNTFTTLFTDDADANVFMTTSVPPAAGDYWALSSNTCQAYSDPHYWAVTSPDTTQVPANLQCWLQTPVVDVSSFAAIQGCTLYCVFQMFMPGAQDGGWQERATADGGATWVTTGAWYGDQCGYGYGPCDHFLFSFPLLGPGLPTGTQIAGRWLMVTGATPNTSDPTCAYLSAGITVDDTWMDVTEPVTPVEDSSWGRIKSMYR